jgi:hypothetical protein
MKRILFLINIFLILAFFSMGSLPAFALNFAPKVLRITGQNYVSYGFSGRPLTIWCSVSGTPAQGAFLIFTNGKAAGIKGVGNGYLGWHYMNQIDTCLYISNPTSLAIGGNLFTWDGKDKTGTPVPKGDYTYYIWAYDAASPGVKVTNFIDPRRFVGSQIVTKNGSGQPLANPVIYDALPNSPISSEIVPVMRNKWVIGNDPKNFSYLETTAYTATNEAPRLVFDPLGNEKYFFTESVMPGNYALKDPGKVILRKRIWTPNGKAELLTDWGNTGEASYPSWYSPRAPLYGMPYSGGPVSDGSDLLFFPYYWIREGFPNNDSGIACVNIHDGTLQKTIHVSNFWSSPPDAVYCPDIVEYGDGSLYVSSPASCLVQVIDPTLEGTRWVNGLGDGIWDKNIQYDESLRKQTWMCFGSSSPPNPASISPDANQFSLFPATGLAAASFGLFAPDGTGLGYFPIPGMADGKVSGLQVVDTRSAFDGMYYSGSGSNSDSTGVWFRGYDSFRGILGTGDLFQPFISVLDPQAGDWLVSGTRHNIVWDSFGVKTVRIDVLIGGYSTWRSIADSVDASARFYSWEVPWTSTGGCTIRISDVSNPALSGTSERFIILHFDNVSDEDNTPHPFVAASNHPNPFNPSTAIRYELGMPGKVTVSVYNSLGQQVRKFDLGKKEKGTYEFLFDGSKLTSGIYFYRVTTEYSEATGKMLLMK